MGGCSWASADVMLHGQTGGQTIAFEVPGSCPEYGLEMLSTCANISATGNIGLPLTVIR